jgi:hypothetical protein
MGQDYKEEILQILKNPHIFGYFRWSIYITEMPYNSDAFLVLAQSSDTVSRF